MLSCRLHISEASVGSVPPAATGMVKPSGSSSIGDSPSRTCLLQARPLACGSPPRSLAGSFHRAGVSTFHEALPFAGASWVCGLVSSAGRGLCSCFQWFVGPFCPPPPHPAGCLWWLPLCSWVPCPRSFLLTSEPAVRPSSRDPSPSRPAASRRPSAFHHGVAWGAVLEGPLCPPGALFP